MVVVLQQLDDHIDHIQGPIQKGVEIDQVSMALQDYARTRTPAQIFGYSKNVEHEDFMNYSKTTTMS